MPVKKQCRTYAEALALLGSKPSRKLENNTYLVRLMDGSNALAVRLHRTNVVTYHADGRIELNTGTWYTVTTKDRIHKYTPASLQIWSERSEWLIRNRGAADETVKYNTGDWAAYEAARWPNAGPVYGFKDGATLNPDGTISHAAEDPHASRKLLRAIRNYAAGYVAAFMRASSPRASRSFSSLRSRRAPSWAPEPIPPRCCCWPCAMLAGRITGGLTRSPLPAGASITPPTCARPCAATCTAFSGCPEDTARPS